MRDYFDFDEPSNYDEIYDSDNPNLIENVSMLRHYRNIWNNLKKPASYFKTTTSVLVGICDVCQGSMDIREAIKNSSSIEKQANDKQKHLNDNAKLVRILAKKRNDICGIGTRKLKLYLNKLIKSGDKLAELYRVALEIEDKNASAKGCEYYKYREKIYNQKQALIVQLIGLCQAWNMDENNDCKVVFGLGESAARETTNVIYFELPHVQQISFHFSPDNKLKKELEQYNKEWDGIVNSSLDKLENAIMEMYSSGISEIKAKLK